MDLVTLLLFLFSSIIVCLEVSENVEYIHRTLIKMFYRRENLKSREIFIAKKNEVLREILKIMK